MHAIADRLTEWVVWFMVIFSPWAFGTTEDWAVGVMNAAGYALGVLFAIKSLARRADRSCLESQGEPARSSRLGIRFLGGATILILAYCLVSALNARCVYLGDYQYKYFPCLKWLPHSYDARLTWQAFWNYLALAIDFWAIRDWLKGLDRSEVALPRSGWFIPRRLRTLLWVLSINGVVLAAQGLLQRVIGGGKLLWLVEPHINKLAESQFGPYAYRSNAAQYFLLLWPVAFGFWHLLRRGSPAARKLRMDNHLLPCILLMAIIPLISMSRAGAIIGIWAIFAVIIVARGDRRTGSTVMLAASLLLGVAVLLGAYLGGEALAKRFQAGPIDLSRLEIWRNTWQAFKQSPLFGTGPGTFRYGLWFLLVGSRSGDRTSAQRLARVAHDLWDLRVGPGAGCVGAGSGTAVRERASLFGQNVSQVHLCLAGELPVVRRRRFSPDHLLHFVSLRPMLRNYDVAVSACRGRALSTKKSGSLAAAS